MNTLRPGQRLVRRAPLDGGLWDRVTVQGEFDTGNGLEVVLAPTEGFATPITATSASVRGVYEAETDAPTPEHEAWVTPSNTVTSP